ncbi:MAG: hypothetical protein HC779_00665 [Phyllobacteriaceae bacterium]|nr:hypothetical protein [Phyllobacteriaceae bacterium]
MPMIIAIGSYWGLGVPAAYAFAFEAGLGAPGIWAGLALGLFATAFLMNMRFFARIEVMRGDAPAQPTPAS